MEVDGRICAGVIPAIRYRKTGGCMETYSVNTETGVDSIEIVPDKMEDASRNEKRFYLGFRREYGKEA